ncbi:hypothetical protein PHJA_001529700 [Phtheirospermum japonicum]|uniref:Uncharacterized protein n=1 Tax=Phtheirospermum japonicum TaxID=374723 RepID=A0A830CBZ7_9LAMI|nr:hypothetical protein PHJA_001529700 [Phtheirospermum japonicum]
MAVADSDSPTGSIGRRDYPDSSTVEKTAAVGDGKMAAVGGGLEKATLSRRWENGCGWRRAREGDAVTVVGRAYGQAILIYLACVFPGVADHLTLEQQLNAITANMVMLSADEEKKPTSVKPIENESFFWLGTRPAVIITSPELIKEVMTKSYLYKKLVNSSPLYKLLAQGVVSYKLSILIPRASFNFSSRSAYSPNGEWLKPKGDNSSNKANR